MSLAAPASGSIATGSFSCEADGDGEEDGIDCATPLKKSSMYWRLAGSYYDSKVTFPIWTLPLPRTARRGRGARTSTGYTSPSWNVFMCPSGRSPLGNKDNSTNSGNVKSSSRDSVKRVPLSFPLVQLHVARETAWTNLKSNVICSSLPISPALVSLDHDARDLSPTSECIDRWASWCLLDLCNDA